MPVEIVIPSPGESITEVTLGGWLKGDGEWVEKDESLVEIESDKVTLELPAPESGVLHIAAASGAEMEVGQVIGSIDADAAPPAGGDAPKATTAPDARSDSAARVEVATATTAAAAPSGPSGDGARATSLAKKVAADAGVDLAALTGTGPSGRITKSDVLAARATPAAASTAAAPVATALADRGVRREKMSKLRRRIAERLVMAQHQAAMLTTFNECDMTEVMRLRAAHKEAFAEKHGVGLGFMGFFVKACCAALRASPGVNAYVIDDEIEYHDFVDVSVAVGTPKGLVVPVLRDADRMSFAEVESTIKDFALRARDGKLTIDEMTGGTFTISNGGVYGSLSSTPILNPPQSGILGMHKIMKRAVEHPEKPGEIALRPMMYLALSYDHRVVDGEQAVRFLVHVKDAIEHPERLLLGL